MTPGRGKDLVALAALSAAALLGAWLFLRTRLELGAAWTDGVRRWGTTSGEEIRHAIWDRPRPWPGSEDGRDPALSPDGRWLVFAVGERGLNAELWAAELEGDGPLEAHPLAGLNSPVDDLAPVFAAGALYFASDRTGGAGGLDLWRVPYRDGSFAAPEPLEPGINTPADECDPAPLPGTDALLLSSNRSRAARADFELYRAERDASGGGFRCSPLDELNTPFDEREPALAPDGRCLYFSSDRGGQRGFDLWRSVRADERWLPPEPVPNMSGPLSERGPFVSADGFELWLELETEPGARALARARSLELFRLPPPRLSLQELLLLAAFLLLALLAFLSKRWRALDILYKCFLVSLLLHLLLLLYLRTVHPRSKSFERGGEEESVHRVRLAPEESGPAGGPGLQAWRGLEPPRDAPERELFATPIEAAAAPPPLALPSPARPLAPAPERAESALEPASLDHSGTAPELADREAPAARFDARTPVLALEARASASPPVSNDAAEPARVSSSSAAPAAPRPAPAAPRLEVPQASARTLGRESAPAPRTESAPLPGRRAAPETRLAGPPERFESPTGTPPAFELSAATPGAPRERGPADASRRAFPAQSPAASPSTSGLPVPAPPASEHAAGVSVPGFEPSLARSAESAAPAALRTPEPGEAPPAAGPGASAALDLTAGLAGASPSPASASREPAAAPGRLAGLPARERAAPEARPLELAPPPESSAPADEAPPRLARTPYQNRFGQQKLRALEEYGGGVETERAVAAGLAYLARIQHREGCWGERSDAHSKYLDVRIGKTGLALLAFLGAGHVPGGATEHTDAVARAVRFLLAVQDGSSGHIGQSCSYGHGIATYALAECFALTHDERLRGPLEHAIGQILRNQSREQDPRFFGGWGYYFADGHTWNGDSWPRTSITAWQVMALESARLGGLAVPEAAFEAAREFVLGAWDARRRAFRYDHDPERLSSAYPILPASTPAALFALSLLDVELDRAELVQARRFVLARVPDGYRYTGDDDFVARAQGNLYFWYYATLAMFRVGGSEWETWNEAMKETLLAAQTEDGSWQPIDTYAEYAGDADEERTYTTAMCVLSLEIYYRYFTPLLQVR